ncbi:hypothetical protein OXX59_004936 [Metschnikowia pulcherrima]
MKLANLLPWCSIVLALFAEVQAQGSRMKVPSAYAPTAVRCPSNDSMIREANSISMQEAAWLRLRHVKTDAAIRRYLNRTGVEYTAARFDAQNNSRPINIALAFSGGGLRAMLTGAGELAALDSRSARADEDGLGGVLQSSSYITGLSGGSWLLSSLVYQNWPTVDEMVFENPNNVWDYNTINTFVNTTEPLDMMLNFAFTNYEKTLARMAWWNMPNGHGVHNDMRRKREAGFSVTATDAMGRGLAHSLFPRGTDNWLESATWSGIRDIRAFANQDMPFPIVTALARWPHSLKYDLNSPIVEFNPYEMGSFDRSINTFHDIRYLGTPVANGVPRGLCQRGYDNAAFVMGTSSSLFNQFLNTLACPDCDSLNKVVKYFVRKFLEFMSRQRLDVAWFEPNPFFASQHAASERIKTSKTLYMMDGGLAGELVPLSTIAVKERELDLVFAFDNEGPGWPDGTSLINTYQRQFLNEGASTVFPHVPGQSTFLHHNLTAKPTFFGCNASNLTALAKDGVMPPIVVYVANRPYEFYSNTSTFKLTYSDRQKKGMVTNGFNVATRGNRTAAPDWPTCVGCAMVRRAEERSNVTQSEQCRQCFQNYCWDGSLYAAGNYSAPRHFSADGLTDEPMELDTHNKYIHKVSTMRKIFGKLIPSLAPTKVAWF